MFSLISEQTLKSVHNFIFTQYYISNSSRGDVSSGTVVVEVVVY